MWKYVRFRIKELCLAVPTGEIRRALEKKLGKKLVLRRMPLGRGWSLKYLAYSEDQPEPEALIKVSSRLNERRLKDTIAQGRYAPPGERFRHEAEVLGSLAELGLAPEILVREEYFVARRYSSGRCLQELSPQEAAGLLPRVLDAIDTAWKTGIFHTDLNAGNVIVTPSGGIHFIDSEVYSDHKSGAPLGEHFRRFCHERLIHSLVVNGIRGDVVNDVLREYYGAREDGAVSVERALELMKPETRIVEFPE